MEEHEPIHPDYLKGFNEGYLISKHLPDLAERLTNAVKETPYAEGFNGGKEQYLFEQKEEKRPSWLKRDVSDIGYDQNKSKEKDKGDLEPDR